MEIQPPVPLLQITRKRGYNGRVDDVKGGNPSVLVVDDDPEIANLIVTALQAESFEVTLAGDAKSALEAVNVRRFDAAVLDLALPDLDGLSLCRKLKELPITGAMPIILLSGVYNNPQDKVHGLLHGADDYLTKPLYLDELVARLRVILRRAVKTLDGATPLSYKTLTVDVNQREVRLKGRKLPLTPKELDLLAVFIQKKGKALSRAFLLETVWGYDYYGTTRTVDVHVANLRAKLGSLGEEIHTVDTVGYRWSSSA